MSRFLNLFSVRQKAAKNEFPDVYQYEEIPHELRVQCIQIFEECMEPHRRMVPDFFKRVVMILRKIFARFYLEGKPNRSGMRGNHSETAEFLDGFLNEGDTDLTLDYIEAFFGVAEQLRIDTRRAVQELNLFFRRSGVGFQYEESLIIRVDDQHIHQTVVKPTLSFLREPYLAGAQDEFLKAHAFYREGNTKDAIHNCCNAFESTMKAIAKKRNWPHPPGATARNLVELMRDKGLVPGYWDNNLNNLTSLLQSSVPTGRNNNGGHGQGAIPVDVPLTVASYILHMTASAILFLAQAEKELK